MELNRKNKILIGAGIAALLLVGKLFSLQIVNDEYKKSSDNNSMVHETIYPTRGIIYDRNGEILVGNKTAYDIIVTPREVPEFDTLALAQALGLDVQFIKDKMAYYRRYRSTIGFQPQTLIKQISPETYLRFVEVQYMFPGFKGQIRSIRDYPVDAGGNLLGYVSEVDQTYIKNHPGQYQAGDMVGKTGIEAAYETELRGEKGYHIYLRDSHNQIQTAYQDGELDVEAVPGNDISTTIDAQLQMYGQQLMKNKVGSIVAIEPKTGEILAMVSSPGISVSQLADIGQHYNDIIKDPYRPLFNRTVQASYPPGSVFKLVNGLIGLDEGVVKTTDRFPCSAGFPYGNGHKLGCHSHASPLDMINAIAASCNGYFCYVFRNILENKQYNTVQEAFDRWRDYVLSFGFGRRLESDFPSELSGNIPSSNYYNKIYGKKGWRFSTILSLSIGQGEIGATPLQIANLCATVANRGYYIIPHIIKDSPGYQIEDKYKRKQYTLVDTTNFVKVIDGMYMAVNGGSYGGSTALSAAIPGLDVCGKTGTAQNPRGADNSVFMCFAPKDDPKIAIVAYIENAGFGATWACPIASLMVEKYLTGEIRESRLATEERILTSNLMPNAKTY